MDKDSLNENRFHHDNLLHSLNLAWIFSHDLYIANTDQQYNREQSKDEEEGEETYIYQISRNCIRIITQWCNISPHNTRFIPILDAISEIILYLILELLILEMPKLEELAEMEI